MLWVVCGVFCPQQDPKPPGGPSVFVFRSLQSQTKTAADTGRAGSFPEPSGARLHFPIQLDQVESVEDGVTDKLASMAWAMMATGECYKEPVARAA